MEPNVKMPGHTYNWRLGLSQYLGKLLQKKPEAYLTDNQNTARKNAKDFWTRVNKGETWAATQNLNYQSTPPYPTQTTALEVVEETFENEGAQTQIVQPAIQIPEPSKTPEELFEIVATSSNK